MILNLSLSLILSSSLAWLMNQAELKFSYFIMSSNLNIIFRLVSSSNQAWTFYFSCRTELEHLLLDKARLVYSPNWKWERLFYVLNIEENSQNLKKALTSPDAIFWKEVVNDEMNSLISNRTWKLVDLPPGCKTIGYKWVLRKKLNRMDQ